MSYAGLKVLVTGADGFIGSHLAERLVSAGASVTSLALYTGQDRYGWLDDLEQDILKEMQLVRGDVRDASMMNRLVKGHDVVFNLAALIAIPHSFEAPQSYIDTNVVGTANILEAARSHGIVRFVHTSTSEVYGTAQTVPISETHPLVAQSPYAATKIAADKLVESYALSFDLPAIILRPFNTYGPRQSERAVISSTIRQALDPDCDVIRVGDISTIRDLNYVDDTVEAFLAIGTAPKIEYGRAYNAGSGVGVTIAEAIDLIRAASGTNKELVSETSRIRPEKSEVRELVANSTSFSKATGWQPATGLDKGIPKTVDWWKQRMERGLLRPDANYML